jgi:CelD/BcsL family acetyltransferase involved in cellulose biosynthesis
MYTVKELPIDEVKDGWEKAQIHGVKSTVFQSFLWNSAWVKTFADNDNVKISVVYDAENIVAIIPIIKLRKFLVPVYRFIADNVSDYNDIIVFKKSSILDEFLCQYLTKLMCKKMNLFLLRNISTASNISRVLGNSVTYTQFSQTVYAKNINNYRDVNCNKKQRNNAKRLYKRLKEKGDIEYSLRGGDKIDLNQLLRFKTSSLKKKGLQSIVFDSRYEEFLYKVMNEDPNSFFISYLKLNGELVSASFNFLHGDTFYYYLPAYNDSFYKYSPSSILLYLMLGDIENMESVSLIDFLKGDEQYKYIWALEHENLPLNVVSSLDAGIMQWVVRNKENGFMSLFKKL